MTIQIYVRYLSSQLSLSKLDTFCLLLVWIHPFTFWLYYKSYRVQFLFCSILSLCRIYTLLSKTFICHLKMLLFFKFFYAFVTERNDASVAIFPPKLKRAQLLTNWARWKKKKSWNEDMEGLFKDWFFVNYSYYRLIIFYTIAISESLIY